MRYKMDIVDFSLTADTIIDESKDDLMWFTENGAKFDDEDIKYTVFDEDNDNVKKEDKSPIFMPCRDYSVAGCKIKSTAHIEPGDMSERPIVRVHMCYMCQKLYRRCMAHSMTNCPVLDVLDRLYQHFSFEREDTDEPMSDDPLEVNDTENTETDTSAQPANPEDNHQSAAASDEHILP